MKLRRFDVGDVVRIIHTYHVFTVAETKDYSRATGSSCDGQAVRDIEHPPDAFGGAGWYWSEGCERFPPLNGAKSK